MDLNDLLARHQMSLMRADGAACLSSRSSHRALARGYAARIRALQRRSGAAACLPAGTGRA